MAEKSLYDSIAGFFGSNPEARAKEMVMSPPPAPPALKPNPGESQLDFSLRQRKANMDHKRILEDRELHPEKYMVDPAGAPVPAAEGDRFNRRAQIEQAVEAAQK